MNAIFKREFRSYFQTPIGYIVLAAFYFFLGMFFNLIYSNGSPNTEMVVTAMAQIVVFIIPVITMRSMSEDRRQKVDQALLTSPVKLTSIVAGKYLAAMALYAIGFAPTIIFEIMVASKVSVNIFSYIYALFGMLLLGSALIAIGMFISSLTESTAISAIISLLVNICVLFMSGIAGTVKIEFISKILEKLSFLDVAQNFAQNVFSVPDVVYFLSISAAFLFLCVRSLDYRRWA